MSAMQRAESIYRRKYGESYPGEAYDGACEAIANAIEVRASEIASKYANDPSKLGQDAIGNDVPTSIVQALVRNIVELRKSVPSEVLGASVKALFRELVDNELVREFAEDEIEREAA